MCLQKSISLFFVVKVLYHLFDVKCINILLGLNCISDTQEMMFEFELAIAKIHCLRIDCHQNY